MDDKREAFISAAVLKAGEISVDHAIRSMQNPILLSGREMMANTQSIAEEMVRVWDKFFESSDATGGELQRRVDEFMARAEKSGPAPGSRGF